MLVAASALSWIDHSNAPDGGKKPEPSSPDLRRALDGRIEFSGPQTDGFGCGTKVLENISLARASTACRQID